MSAKNQVLLNCKQCEKSFSRCFSLRNTAKFCSRICQRKAFGLAMVGNTVNLGRVHSEEEKEKNRQRNLGKTLSEAHKKKISVAHMGKIGHTSWNKGKKYPAVTGEKNNNWKGGITPYYRVLRVARLRAVGGSHTKQEWDVLKAQYNWTCLCCKKSDVKLTKDHIIPVSKGGSDNIQNIQPLCTSCNSRKNVKIIDYQLTETSYGV